MKEILITTTAAKLPHYCFRKHRLHLLAVHETMIKTDAATLIPQL